MAHLQLDSALYADILLGGMQCLSANAAVVNDLNVFPIPDGDTGENMLRTLEGGVLAPTEESLGQWSRRSADGMLLHARGNSGVILSRFFAGIAEAWAEKNASDARDMASAFVTGVTKAYASVARPTEGTILTVLREAAAYAESQLSPDCTIEGYLENFDRELRCSLQRTPDLLPVLKEAGVVDSGGAGMVYILEGMRKALRGEHGEESHLVQTRQEQPDFSKFGPDSVMEFGYCTEFLLQLQTCKCNPESFDENILSAKLQEMGDSVVCFKAGTVIKAHVHTLQPGDILNLCRKYGEFLTLKIENMTLQHNNSMVENRFTLPVQKKRFGIAAVAMGAGIRQTFLDLGVDAVIDGGQTQNPSTEDFIRAFRSIFAETLFVFPNNSNILLAARQAAELYTDAEVRVIPSHSIGEGYAALSMMDSHPVDADEVEANFLAAMEGVVTGAVSRATREAVSNGLTIRPGDYIGFAGKEIHVVAEDRLTALRHLAETLEAGNRDVVLLLRGKEVTEEEMEAASEAVSEVCCDSDFFPMDGGQAVYDYLLILE